MLIKESFIGFSEMTLPTQTHSLRNGWLDALALDFAFYSQPATSTFSQQFRIGTFEIIFSDDFNRDYDFDLGRNQGSARFKIQVTSYKGVTGYHWLPEF